MEMTYVDTPTDTRGAELFEKMRASSKWIHFKFKKIQRERSNGFTIGFDIILRKVDQDDVYIFLSMRETDEGTTKTFTYKEQKTTNFRES